MRPTSSVRAARCSGNASLRGRRPTLGSCPCRPQRSARPSRASRGGRHASRRPRGTHPRRMAAVSEATGAWPMDDADREFYRGHVEVVPRFYRKRLHALCDWESPLERVQRQDELLELYLGILEQGGDDALEVAREHARPESPGSYFAAASLACRLDRFEVVRAILGELEAACSAPRMTGEAAA